MSMIGDNTQAVDFALIETERLEQDYGSLKNSTQELIEEADEIALPILDDDHKSTVTSMIKRLRDAVTHMEGIHQIEKQPHLRRGQAVDQFFGRLVERLRKRNKNDRDGVGDTLQRELTAYDTRKLMEEQARLRQAALKAAREAAEKAAAEEKARADAEAARLAAERARKPEHQAAKEVLADQAETNATVATVETKLAETRAEEALVQSYAKPADIMRTRGADGTLATMAQENFSQVLDRTKLDLEKLRPYLPMDGLEKALRAYAASVGYSADASVQIAGATFGKRPRSVVR